MMLQKLSNERNLSFTVKESTTEADKRQPTLNHVISTKATPVDESGCVSLEKERNSSDCCYEQSNSDVTTQLDGLRAAIDTNSNVSSERGNSVSGSGIIMDNLSEELQQSLRRQGLTVDDLLNGLPEFAVKWKSIRDVSQCSTCASPIDFLSRKVSVLLGHFLNLG